ncbi:MAG: two pore domain potassium channel family protein [Rhodospirillales bacterium]|nr:two pore domain potassium channel family protein [Rhodospirillales bacterium]
MLYFSSIVITTVGFGDIVPMTALARGIVAFEAVLGVILAGLFLNAIAYRAAGGR